MCLDWLTENSVMCRAKKAEFELADRCCSWKSDGHGCAGPNSILGVLEWHWECHQQGVEDSDLIQTPRHFLQSLSII